MLRISDIFKKIKEEKDKANAAAQNQGQANPEPAQETQASTPDPQEKNPPSSSAKVSISQAINKELTRISATDIGELYAKGLFYAKRLYKVDLQYEEGIIANITTFVEKIIDLLEAGNKDLLRYCLADYSGSEDYIYCHAINTCVIALEMGKGLGYEHARLVELGIAAFVHDLGLIKFLDVINRKDILSKEELDKLRQHPYSGVEMLGKFSKEVSHNVFEVIKQEHERADGSGYPQCLKGDQITEYARVIGLADVYEAMTHKRPYRMRHNPLETIKTILGSKASFDARIIKVLIERIGVFPMGTLCRLNTKEIALVLKENPNLPLRPTVKIMFDAYGKELAEQRQVNLAD
ncbi:MAG: HD domain-containing protein, partial [Candidatus Omnitrophica bacterium]|nr:HD domain-containing protein [Candidatus Omnitrophota bacterium]